MERDITCAKYAHMGSDGDQERELKNKVDFFVRTSLPLVEGIFYDGQIFDAYRFASDLVRKAKKSVVLIDDEV